jgi:hypothetical protein
MRPDFLKVSRETELHARNEKINSRENKFSQILHITDISKAHSLSFASHTGQANG